MRESRVSSYADVQKGRNSFHRSQQHKNRRALFASRKPLDPDRIAVTARRVKAFYEADERGGYSNKVHE